MYDFQRAAYKNPEFIGAWFKLVGNIRAKYGIAKFLGWKYHGASCLQANAAEDVKYDRLKKKETERKEDLTKVGTAIYRKKEVLAWTARLTM